jgi:hypothetical protein
MRTKIAALVLLLSCFFVTPAFAQFGVGWKISPTVTVIGSEGDVRQAMVEKAVAYWNRVFEEQGTSFRIGTVSKVSAPVPESELSALSNMVVGRSGSRVEVPNQLTAQKGEILVYLGETAFVSFVSPVSNNGKRVVGIRNVFSRPMNLPNVAINVITHELGHALGIGHNSDESTLMCGRPANCRPDAFNSLEEKLFPLSPSEISQIQTMYPKAWKAQE